MQGILSSFDAIVRTAVSVSQVAHTLDAQGNYTFALPERELMTQSCFVRMFVAFEEFLEQSFGHYGMGGLSLQGNAARCYANAPNLDHLHSMFIGMMRFMDWSTPDKVRELARLYFPTGGPFETPLASAHTHLLDMKTVRNAASHVSRTTTTQADTLYLRWTSQPVTSVSAYQLLTAVGGPAGTTFMSHAETILRGVTAQIANH